jgi:hypothetical protein
MAPSRKQKKSKSVMGRILPPVNIESANDLAELDKRIALGPITIVFVLAPWCPHCVNLKPKVNELEALPGRTIQTARIRDDIYPNSSISQNKIESYPTVMLVDKTGKAIPFKTEDGKETISIPDYKNMDLMKSIVKNAGKEQIVNTLSLNAKHNKTIDLESIVANNPSVVKDDQHPTLSMNGKSPQSMESEPKANVEYVGNVKSITPYLNQLNTDSKKLVSKNTTKVNNGPNTLLNQSPVPPNINRDRINVTAANAAINNVVNEHSSQKIKETKGGSLLSFLSEAAYSTGPALGLLALAAIKTSRRSRRVTRKGRKGGKARKSRKTIRRKH